MTMINPMVFAMDSCGTPTDLPQPAFTYISLDARASIIQRVMLADNNTPPVTRTAILPATAATPFSGPSTAAPPPPADPATGPENSKEEPNLVTVIALPVIAAVLLGVIFVLLHQFRKGKKREDLGAEDGAFGKAQLSSDGVLQVEPQELSADPPEPKELEVYETPVEVKADVEFPVEIASAAGRNGQHKNRNRWGWVPKAPVLIRERGPRQSPLIDNFSQYISQARLACGSCFLIRDYH